MDAALLPDLAAIRAARGADRAARAPHAGADLVGRSTPRCGARLFFKCENLQKIGAFKARGATNAVSRWPPTSPLAAS